MCVCIVRLQRVSSVRVCITDIIIRVYNITTRCILIRHTTSAHDIFLYEAQHVLGLLIRHTTSAHDIFLYDTTTSLYDTFSCDITVRYILRLQRCALLGTSLIAPCRRGTLSTSWSRTGRYYCCVAWEFYHHKRSTRRSRPCSLCSS